MTKLGLYIPVNSLPLVYKVKTNILFLLFNTDVIEKQQREGTESQLSLNFLLPRNLSLDQAITDNDKYCSNFQIPSSVFTQNNPLIVHRILLNLEYLQANQIYLSIMSHKKGTEHSHGSMLLSHIRCMLPPTFQQEARVAQLVRACGFYGATASQVNRKAGGSRPPSGDFFFGFCFFNPSISSPFLFIYSLIRCFIEYLSTA